MKIIVKDKLLEPKLTLKDIEPGTPFRFLGSAKGLVYMKLIFETSINLNKVIRLDNAYIPYCLLNNGNTWLCNPDEEIEIVKDFVGIYEC